jgi:hypothetical protein
LIDVPGHRYMRRRRRGIHEATATAAAAAAAVATAAAATAATAVAAAVLFAQFCCMCGAVSYCHHTVGPTINIDPQGRLRAPYDPILTSLDLITTCLLPNTTLYRPISTHTILLRYYCDQAVTPT